MTNLVFSRRAVQAAIDRLGSVITFDQIKSIVDRLNLVDRNRLPAMWELVVLDALARVGSLVHEAPLSDGRRPDIDLTVPSDSSGMVLRIVGDVATVSDSGLDEQNPVDIVREQIDVLAKKYDLPRGSFNWRVEGERMGEPRDAKPRLKLPGKGELLELFRTEVRPWMQSLKASPETRAQWIKLTEDTSLSIAYVPGQLFSGGGYLSYTATGSIDRNPLYLALKSKAGQLRAAPVDAVRLIFACDGDNDLLRQRMKSSPLDYSANDVVRRFLKRHSSIDGVVMISVDEHHGTFGTPTVRRLRVDVELQRLSSTSRLTSDAMNQLDRALRSAVDKMPSPRISTYTAAQRARQQPIGDDKIGGYKMSANRVTISSRALQRLLAGAITSDDFLAQHEWGEESRPTNPFLRALSNGQMINEIAVEDGGDDDDDYITFSFGSPDPAAAVFRLPTDRGDPPID